MLATPANTAFKKEHITGMVEVKYTVNFIYKYNENVLCCDVCIYLVPAIAPDDARVHTDLVGKINESLCRSYPYEQLCDIQPVSGEPVAIPLANVIAQTAAELIVAPKVPDTWHLVCDEFVKIFAPAVSQQVMQEIVTFFDAVMRKFTHRAYQTGWQEGYKRGKSELQV